MSTSVEVSPVSMIENPHSLQAHGPLGVHKAIAAVSSAIGKVGIGKTRRNEEQRFNFRGIDDVLNALSPLLSEHGLVIVPRVTERVLVESKTGNGKALWKVTLRVDYHLIAVADGSREVATTYGEAMDMADKATNKALSAAYKYLAIQIFAIPVEGTPDADADGPMDEAIGIPPAALAAARKGTKAYEQFFKGLTRQGRSELLVWHDGLKSTAEKADAESATA